MSCQRAEERIPEVQADGNPSGDATLQTALREGLARMNAGDLAGALAHLLPVAELAARRPMASYVFGLFHVNCGEAQIALDWFERALAQDPQFIPALAARAIALQKLGRPQEALASLEAILELNPKDHEALYMSGVILQNLEHREAALAFYDRALAVQPEYVQALLNRGVLLEQLSRLDEALTDFETALALRPADAMLNFNRGLVLQRLGRLDAALAAYDQARAYGTADPEVELNRGNVLQMLGRCAEALDCYDAALKLRPDYPQALYNRGIALHRLRRPAEAIAAFDAAIGQRPAYPEAYCNRGNVLHETGRLVEALASYDAALQLRPQFPQAEINRANVLFAQQRYAAALEACAAILKREPDHAPALCIQGVAYQKLARFDAALAALEHALRARPAFPEAWLNHGNVLQECGRYETAIASYDQALALRPDYAEVLSSRGVALKELGRFAEAKAAFEKALALKPAYPDARNNLAGVLLLGGDLKRGFAAFESRWERTNAPRKTLYSALPTWSGEPLAGKRLLVWDEQGLGDLIQFCRYLPGLAAQGAQVTLLSRPSMFRLLATLAVPMRFIDHVDDESVYDYQIALMSLPYVLGTELASIPAAVPYLKVEAERAALWKTRIGDDGFRVGICWHGNRKINLERNIPVAEFAPLAAIEGVRLISLMKDGAHEARTASFTIEIPTPDLDAGPEAFQDTAALMTQLDLVVTSDTSIAHLAGALGRPTFLALRHVPDWRWLAAGEASPWYPTLRLFRQETRGQWGPVMARLAVAVRAKMNKATATEQHA